MTIESIIPIRLRAEWLCYRVIRLAAVAVGKEGVSPSVALEREFRELIRLENATISRICFNYSGSVAEFDDLRQDALINIWRGMQSYRGASSRKTWIYRVTVNSCLSTIRKETRHQHESLESLYGLIYNDDTDKERIEHMHRAIGKLPTQERAIIMMWLDDMSYEEISSAMGLNRNTVASKIRRIKEKIAKEYDN